MSPGSKVLVGAVVVGLAFGLIVWKKGQPRDVRLSGVTKQPTAMTEEVGAGGGRQVPKGIVVHVSKIVGDEWAYVTIPASIADALFDVNQDVSGWVPFAALEDVVPRA